MTRIAKLYHEGRIEIILAVVGDHEDVTQIEQAVADDYGYESGDVVVLSIADATSISSALDLNIGDKFIDA